MHHLTLNTRHSYLALRGDMPEDEIERHAQIIVDQEGPIPGIEDWFFDLMLPLDAGRRRKPREAFFQIADLLGMSKTPSVMGIVYWDREMAHEAWAQARMGYTAQKDSLQRLGMWRDMPANPPRPPWMAVWLTAFVLMEPMDAAQKFARDEQGLAWALMG